MRRSAAARLSVPSPRAVAAGRAPTQEPGVGVAWASDRLGESAGETLVVPDASGPIGWGALPLLALVSALGLLLVAWGVSAARVEGPASAALFWSGLLLLVMPVAARLGGAGASRRERMGLVALVGVGLYLVKVWHSPLHFTFYDELQHWRTADDVLRGGRLFGENPVLPVSPFYPGLENVTSAVAGLSGLSVFSAGLLIVGVARLVLVLSLYCLYDEVGGSPRVAGIAALLYMANPNFLFFDAQFAYESLALPFATLTLFVMVRRSRAPAGGRVGLTLAALLGIGAVVTTHHLTAYALVAFLVLWTALGWIVGGRRGEQPGPGGLALTALVASAAWLVYVATLTLSYLTPILGGGFQDLLQTLATGGTGRRLFQDATGQRAPLWEQLAGYAAAVSLLLMLPYGLLRVWRRYRGNAAALALAAGALGYPASLALRLTSRGLEVANRSSEFLFVPLAFVVAAAVGGWWRAWPGDAVPRAAARGAAAPGGLPVRVGRADRWRAPVFAGWSAVLFVGGVILGWPAYARLPGPYLPAGPVRSIEPQSMAAAEWARRYLGPDNAVATDVSNQLIMGSYGGQRVERNGNYVPTLFLSPEVGPAERAIVRNWRIRYLAVDRRLSSGPPLIGIYYGVWEPNAYQHTQPADAGALDKFDGLPGVHRLLDGGSVVVYDVGGLADVP